MFVFLGNFSRAAYYNLRKISRIRRRLSLDGAVAHIRRKSVHIAPVFVNLLKFHVVSKVLLMSVKALNALAKALSYPAELLDQYIPS